jgi:hypothetical protein
VVGGVEKKQDGRLARGSSDTKIAGNRKSLMNHDFQLRTGLGAKRWTTAKLGHFSRLSTSISTGFSTVSSENAPKRGGIGLDSR